MPETSPNVEALRDRALAAADRYLEFLRVPSMSVGVYVLAAGSKDPQTPHRQDEIYYVLRGRSKFRRGDEELDVEPGDVIFVGPGISHHFHSIREELVLLVVFAPAEQST